ncbi:MAG: carbohydrate kinase [Demequina sp.]
MSGHALVIGEALVDIVRRPSGEESLHPGGSAANVAIGLGRLDRDVELLAWIGQDEHGALIRAHMEDSAVAVARGSETAPRTSVAVANLDDNGVAQYDFDLTWDVNPQASPRTDPLVVHTGSIGAVVAPGAAAVVDMVRSLRPGATITYDPNARPALMGDPGTARQSIERVVALADVVKVSDEDLEWLAPDTAPVDMARGWLMPGGPAMVIVTRGGDGASAYLHDGRTVEVTAPTVDVADTVGAGDSFMGGLIDGLWSADLLGGDKRDALRGIESAVLETILERSARIAAITVSRSGANPPRTAELE